MIRSFFNIAVLIGVSLSASVLLAQEAPAPTENAAPPVAEAAAAPPAAEAPAPATPAPVPETPSAAAAVAVEVAVPEKVTPKPTLVVFPSSFVMTSKQDDRSFVAQLIYPDETTMDVTAKVVVEMPEALVRVEGNKFYPIADGKTEITFRVDDQLVKLPIEVKDSQKDRALTFRQDVMPIFMKSGCNTGSCHGAARGKDGFMLSLFGYDPNGDQVRITTEQLGRRINLEVPSASLLVEKSVGAVPHTGGKRMEPDSLMAKTMIDWIAMGAPADGQAVAACERIEISPRHAVLRGDGQNQKLTVLAYYSDGTQRDITRLSVFLSNNDHVATVNEAGVISSRHPGEAFMMARFDEHTVGIPVMVIPQEEPKLEPAAFTVATIAGSKEVDETVNKKLRQLRMQPSGLCTDEEFIRRVYIDLIGQVPTPEQYKAFMESKSPSKRSEVIDQLLSRVEFQDLWVGLWSEWLMLRSSNEVSYKSIVLYHQWLEERLVANVPIDQIVKELLTGEGGTFSQPQTNFYEIERDTLKTSENVAQIFMGMRIQCAQCHNHPFDRWTQDDYYGFAAFFSQIGRKAAEDKREKIVFNSFGGEVKHPVGGRNIPPVFLGGSAADTKGKDRRQVVADWLVSPENPWFARNFANRIWHHFFGIGIVDPVDDVRDSNPASNEALLALLTDHLVDAQFDFKTLIREICNSHTYQRATSRNETNALDERNFSHQTVRRIKAEQMLDILSLVTASQDKFNRLPLGSRAVEIADGNTSTYFLTTFGRSTRLTACSCEVRMEPNLSQALHMINGEAVNGKMQRGGLVKQWTKDKLSPEQAINEIYVRSLSRYPNADEVAALMELYANERPFEQATEDVFWAVLNSREFLFNH
jgi:hypothetical protein